jgi:hypothetical protein
VPEPRRDSAARSRDEREGPVRSYRTMMKTASEGLPCYVSLSLVGSAAYGRSLRSPGSAPATGLHILGSGLIDPTRRRPPQAES